MYRNHCVSKLISIISIKRNDYLNVLACSKPCDCFVFVISSHGQEVLVPGTSNVYVYDQTVLGSDGEAVSVDALFKCMDNEVLKGIPKLCFIQVITNIVQVF